MIPYKEREIKLRPPKTFKSDHKWLTFDRWYCYLINDWIPNQPDAFELMKLFIDCEFNSTAFVKVLVGQESTPNEAPAK